MNIDRRSFLKTAAFSALAPGFLEALAGVRAETLKIRDIQIWKLDGKRPPSEGFVGWIQANPSKIYDFNPPIAAKEPLPQPKVLESQSALYLKVITNDDIEGLYGPIDSEVASVIHNQIKPRLIGCNPLRSELIWDELYRSYRHSRAGLYMMAISAVDNVLWDIRGKFFDAPVYQLLGGPTRAEIPVYASCLGFSIDPEAAAHRSLLLAGQGYTQQKWFFSFGPSQGAKGMEFNVQLAKSLRETLGTGIDIFFDAFMGWSLDYALAWVTAAEPWQPNWLEEAFQPTEINSFTELRRKSSIPVASGEHLYNRWEVMSYLEADALSIIQTDPEWCGGVSELVKICTMASGFNAQVIPHGHSLHAALHVIASQSPDVCPMGEYLINKMDYYYMFEKLKPTPVNGKISLTTQPGFGIEFDDAAILHQQQLFI
ncbi:MAG: mandelate racemase [Calditrichaeota bacterium]|nr:MAG: mandelate racemase [Calditrichota bacterium]